MRPACFPLLIAALLLSAAPALHAQVNPERPAGELSPPPVTDDMPDDGVDAVDPLPTPSTPSRTGQPNDSLPGTGVDHPDFRRSPSSEPVPGGTLDPSDPMRPMTPQAPAERP